MLQDLAKSCLAYVLSRAQQVGMLGIPIPLFACFLRCPEPFALRSGESVLGLNGQCWQKRLGSKCCRRGWAVLRFGETFLCTERAIK